MSERSYLFVGGIARGKWIAAGGRDSVRVVVPPEISSLSTTHYGLDGHLKYHLYLREELLLFGHRVTVYLHEDDRCPGVRDIALIRALLNEDGRQVIESSPGYILL